MTPGTLTCWDGSAGEAGISRTPAAKAAMPTGTLIRKIARQSSPATFAASKTPPSSGPAAPARASTIP